MRKIYSIIAPALLVAASVGAVVSLPYASGSFDDEIAGALADDGWSQYDALGTSYWKKDTRFQYNSQKPASLGNPESYQSDDWLISPAFDVTAGNDYTIDFAHRSLGATLPEKFTVYFTTVSPITDAEAAAAAPSQQATNAIATTYATESMTFRATATGQAYFAIRYAGEQRNNIFVAGVNITETVNAVTPPVVDPVDHDCAGIATPYTSSLAVSSSKFDEGWVIVDENEDGTTWTTVTDSKMESGLAAKYGWNKNNPGDDYLISPAIHLDGGKEYRVAFTFRTQSTSYEEAVTLYVSLDNTAENILAGTELKTYNGKYSSVEKAFELFTPEQTGDYYFSFYAHSISNQYGLFVGDFAVIENVFAPAKVSGLKATLGANRALELTLAWELPTTDAFGDPLPEDKPVEQVLIYRDGSEAPVATLDGTATTWTDTEATGLTSGKHTYTIIVVPGGAKSGEANVATGYCGPLVPAPVPADFSINNEDDFGLYTYINPEDAAKNLIWTYTSNSDGNFAKLNPYANQAEDNWIITPPIAVSTPGYYRVLVDSRLSSATTTGKLDGYIGTSSDIADMTFCSELPMTNIREERAFDFYAATPGTYYAAIHACHPAREVGMYYEVHGTKVENSKFYPAAVTNLTAVPAADFALAIDIAWTAPTLSFGGQPMTDDQYTISVKIDGTESATFPGGTSQATVPVTESGLHTVTVITKSTDGDSIPVHPSVQTAWVGPRTVPVPYSIDLSKNDPTIDIWEMIDGNADGNTWYYSSQFILSLPSAVDGVRHSNDFLLSPYFDLTAGFYKIRAKMRGGYNSIYFKPTFAMVAAGTLDPANKTYVASTQVEVTSNSLAWVEWTFEIPEDGMYQFVIDVQDQENISTYSTQAIHDFEINRVKVLATQAEEVTVTPAADQILEATISWLNPTNTNVGKALVEGDIVKAEIYRNGKLAGTVTEGLVPGATSTYVDTNIELPGVYKYRVDIYTQDGNNFGDNVTSGWIGGGLPTPYVASKFDGNTEFLNWRAVNANNDKGYYNEYTFSYSTTDHDMQLVSSANEADDWAISRPINFEKDCVYLIAIGTYHRSTADYTPDYLPVAIHVGSDETITDTEALSTAMLPKEARGVDNIQYDTIYVHAIDPAELAQLEVATLADETDPEEPVEEDPTDPGTLPSIKVPAGANVIGVHVANYKCLMTLAHAEVQMIERIDTGVEDITVDSDMNYADGIFTFDGTADVRVYNLAGALVATDTATGSYSIRGCQSGIYIVRIHPAAGRPAAFKVIR